jgi:phosphoribosylamine-glycine ligase
MKDAPASFFSGSQRVNSEDDYQRSRIGNWTGNFWECSDQRSGICSFSSLGDFTEFSQRTLEAQGNMGSHRNLRVLLVGSGAREHALAWKLCKSPITEHVYVVPGNAGTAALPNVSNHPETAIEDYPGLVSLAKTLHIDLVVVGPDSAVVDGIEGYFRNSKIGTLLYIVTGDCLYISGKIPCFAPTKEAAELEGSKTFAKDFMTRHTIPTARYQSFSDLKAAKDHIHQVDYRVVIKASGLAAGKGVIIPSSTDEALEGLEDILEKRKFGDAGSSVVVEEYLEGQEISVLTLSDGSHTWSFPPGQDHKRAYDGDKGLNTGGMGVYAPTPFVTPSVMQEIDRLILHPTFEGLRLEGKDFLSAKHHPNIFIIVQLGRTFTGCLFTGIILTSSGPKVLEYNTRFGDPETQSMIPLLDDKTDLTEVLLACTECKLDQVYINTVAAFACNVVIASGGYPLSYRGGDTIEIRKAETGDRPTFLETLGII